MTDNCFNINDSKFSKFYDEIKNFKHLGRFRSKFVRRGFFFSSEDNHFLLNKNLKSKFLLSGNNFHVMFSHHFFIPFLFSDIT